MNAECIERVHISFCKYIINAKQTTNNNVVYSELGRYPLAVEKVQVGKDQEKTRSEKDSHSKNRGGKKLN